MIKKKNERGINQLNTFYQPFGGPLASFGSYEKGKLIKVSIKEGAPRQVLELLHLLNKLVGISRANFGFRDLIDLRGRGVGNKP